MSSFPNLQIFFLTDRLKMDILKGWETTHQQWKRAKKNWEERQQRETGKEMGASVRKTEEAGIHKKELGRKTAKRTGKEARTRIRKNRRSLN